MKTKVEKKQWLAEYHTVINPNWIWDTITSGKKESPSKDIIYLTVNTYNIRLTDTKIHLFHDDRESGWILDLWYSYSKRCFVWEHSKRAKKGSKSGLDFACPGMESSGECEFHEIPYPHPTKLDELKELGLWESHKRGIDFYDRLMELYRDRIYNPKLALHIHLGNPPWNPVYISYEDKINRSVDQTDPQFVKDHWVTQIKKKFHRCGNGRITKDQWDGDKCWFPLKDNSEEVNNV